MVRAYRVATRSRAALRNVGSPRGSRACPAHQLQLRFAAHGMADYNRVRGAADETGQYLDMTDIIMLRLVAEAAVRHVLQHPAAQIADGLGA